MAETILEGVHTSGAAFNQDVVQDILEGDIDSAEETEELEREKGEKEKTADHRPLPDGQYDMDVEDEQFSEELEEYEPEFIPGSVKDVTYVRTDPKYPLGLPNSRLIYVVKEAKPQLPPLCFIITGPEDGTAATADVSIRQIKDHAIQIFSRKPHNKMSY